MVTLDELCAAMDASGRFLTERAARDWWTKGLLPRPKRRGRGRGIGTETYWRDPRVIAQAKAANDFLAVHSRTYSAALHLWLSGFPIDLRLVRGAYQRIIGRHFRSLGRGRMNDLEEAVSGLATNFARDIAKSKPLPKEAMEAIADMASSYLHIFYGTGEEFEATGLAELWAIAEPYTGAGKQQASHSITDNELEVGALYLGQFASLPVQRAAVEAASDYEMIRARRVLQFVLGNIRRMVMSLPDSHDIDKQCGSLHIILGRPAIPILIMILGDDTLRRTTIPFLFDLAIKLRRHLRAGGAVSRPVALNATTIH
jgi:hypothetical protein